MTTETEIPEPSQVIQDYLDAGDTRWTRGAMTKAVRKADGTKVMCHCGARILYDRLVDLDIVERRPGSDVAVEHTIRQLYTLSADQVDTAIGINDDLDPRDAADYARLLLQNRGDGGAPIFEFFQEIAPRYLRRVRDYYRGVGR